MVKQVFQNNGKCVLEKNSKKNVQMIITGMNSHVSASYTVNATKYVLICRSQIRELVENVNISHCFTLNFILSGLNLSILQYLNLTEIHRNGRK